MTRQHVRAVAQKRLRASGLSLRRFAASIGLETAAHLCRFLKYGIEPQPHLTRALGYRRIDAERYEPDRG